MLSQENNNSSREIFNLARSAVNLSPSRKDGISEQQEAQWKRRYCLLIERAALAIPLNNAATMTAISYCHRFYLSKSLATNDPFVVAAAALYLACKVEEQPKSINTVCEEFFKAAYRNRPKILQIAENREFSVLLKEKVILAERALLYALGFNVEVANTSQIALEFLQNCHNYLLPEELRISLDKWTEECELQTGPSYDLMNELSIVTWNLCLTSPHITNVLQYEANHIAAACIFVALQILGLQPALHNGWHWWEQAPLNVPFDTLQGIVEALLDAHEVNSVEQQPDCGNTVRELQ